MRVTVESPSPLSLAVMVPDPDRTKWAIINPTSGAKDPYPGPKPDLAHLLPMNGGPAGATGNTLWADLPPAMVLRNAILYAYVVDAAGNVAASPGAVQWSWVIDDGVLFLRFAIGRA